MFSVPFQGRESVFLEKPVAPLSPLSVMLRKCVISAHEVSSNLYLHHTSMLNITAICMGGSSGEQKHFPISRII